MSSLISCSSRQCPTLHWSRTTGPGEASKLHPSTSPHLKGKMLGKLNGSAHLGSECPKQQEKLPCLTNSSVLSTHPHPSARADIHHKILRPVLGGIPIYLPLYPNTSFPQKSDAQPGTNHVEPSSYFHKSFTG